MTGKNICCVDGCENRVQGGLSFFRCPKEQQRCQVWKDALGFTGSHKYSDFTPEQCHTCIRICALHFDENCFANSSRSRIHSYSVPTLKLLINSVAKDYIHTSTSVYDLAVSNTNDNNTNQCDVEQNVRTNDACVQTSYLDYADYSDHIDACTQTTLKLFEKALRKSALKEPVKTLERTINTYTCKRKLETEQQHIPLSQINENGNPVQQNNICKNEASSSVVDSSTSVHSHEENQNVSCATEHNAIQPTESQETTYSINDLERELDAFGVENIGLLYQHWAVIKRPSGILFQYMGDLDSYPSRYIFIKEDLSIEIRANNNIVNSNILKTVSSLQDVLSAMLTIGSRKLCQGVDSSRHCPIGFFEPAQNSRTDRCTRCKGERKRKVDRESKRMKRTFPKQQEKHKFDKSLKEEYERLDSKFASLKGTLGQHLWGQLKED